MKEHSSPLLHTKLVSNNQWAHQLNCLCLGQSGVYTHTHTKKAKAERISDTSIYTEKGFPGGSECKMSACNAGDPGSIPGLGRSPGEGNGSPLQYSCPENPLDRGAWGARVHKVTKS